MNTPVIHLILVFVEWILFIPLCLTVLYFAFFAMVSRFRQKKYIYPETGNFRKFLVIIPAYAEDKVIVDSARRMKDQLYPSSHYKVVIVSDHHTDETNQKLAELPVQTLIATYENSSKAKALQLAMNSQDEGFDKVVILDADNMVEPDFLQQLNRVCEYGFSAIQCHRVASPTRQTSVARLDAISEEINNSIFRRAHITLGMSSALIGSGMCFDYGWFAENVHQLSTAGEDKELEKLLLFQQIHIHYADKLYVYDEKVKKSGNFQQQRRRWIVAQYMALRDMLRDLPKALHPFNLDYVDKTFQQMILPRILNLFALGFMAVLVTFCYPAHSLKWWGLLFLFLLSLYTAIPQYYKTRDTLNALMEMPRLVGLTLLNLFHLHKVKNKFIHTRHDGE